MFDPVALLDRSPDWVRRLSYRIAAGEGVLGKLADSARFRFSESEIPTLPPPADTKDRLLIGPANSAGQANQWALAVEREFGDVSAIAMRGIGKASSVADADLVVPVAAYQRSVKWHAIFEEFLSQQSHVVWESGLPLLGRRYGSDPAREIRELESRGVHAALMFHGSDIRPPSRHAAESPWSPFGSVSGAVRALEEGAAKNAALVAETDVPVFVSTPDLLRWLPQATWCPVVVDVAKWRLAAKIRDASLPPVVLHAPSRAWLKGTDAIEPILNKLADEGVIEYRQVKGVSHSDMPALYSNADIVLDQFALGSYGVTSCEAMAAGKLVFCHVDEATRARVKQATGFELPILEATVASLESELRKVVTDPGPFEQVKSEGVAFVAGVHSGGYSANMLSSSLQF